MRILLGLTVLILALTTPIQAKIIVPKRLSNNPASNQRSIVGRDNCS
ncbi:MAG: hypothetical protein J7K36_07040 [Archaeoglobaceae archaeon]|nr:hypothetical protein [Archaeoglobaceae archaeon]